MDLAVKHPPTKEAREIRPGMNIKWDWLTWYHVLKAEQVGQWVFLTLDGHPLEVCTIWYTAPMPIR